MADLRQRRPRRVGLHRDDELGRQPHGDGHEELNRVTRAPGRDQAVELRHVVVRQRRTRVVDDERRLVDRELADREAPGSCVERQNSAGRTADDERWATGFGNHRVEVFDLALDRVGLRVPALAAAPSIVGDHRELRCQQLGELRGGLIDRTMGDRAVDEDDRRPVPGPLDRDRRSVGRAHLCRHDSHSTPPWGQSFRL